MTIVVVGDLMLDVVAAHEQPLAAGSDTPATTRLLAGGAGGNVAAWLAHAGADVALIARTGDDAFADAVVAGLDRVDTRVVRARGETTGVCVVLVDRDCERTMLPAAGANEGLDPADLPPDLFTPRNVLYLSGYTLLRERSRAAGLEALARARAHAMPIVIDPASAAPLAACGEFGQLAGEVDLVLANAEEAAVLGDSVSARERVVKRGAYGASWTDGTRHAAVPADPADVIDTTGAGDAFAAGFLTAWPGPPEPALAAAAALAAEAVAVPGGRPS